MGNYVALTITSSQTMTVHLKYRVEIAERKKKVKQSRTLKVCTKKKKKDEKKLKSKRSRLQVFLFCWFGFDCFTLMLQWLAICSNASSDFSGAGRSDGRGRPRSTFCLLFFLRGAACGSRTKPWKRIESSCCGKSGAALTSGQPRGHAATCRGDTAASISCCNSTLCVTLHGITMKVGALACPDHLKLLLCANLIKDPCLIGQRRGRCLKFDWSHAAASCEYCFV